MAATPPFDDFDYVPILGKLVSRNLITDVAGNDAIGAVGAPAAGTVLALLAAIATEIATLDAGDASAANQVTANTALAAIQTALAASLPNPTGAATASKQDGIKSSIDTLVPYVDGLEGLLTAIGTLLAGTLTVGLPAGAATQTTLAAVLAALVGTLKTVPTLAASAITPVAQALTTAVRSNTLTPITGRDFNVTIEGGVGVVATVDRRFTGDATWHTVISDTLRQSLPPSLALTETETGVDYSVNISAITSGTCNVRISA